MRATCDICNKQRHANDIEKMTLKGVDLWVCTLCVDNANKKAWLFHKEKDDMKKAKINQLGFIKEKLPILPPHARGRATGELVQVFRDLEPNEECITFTDKKLWGNAYRCIGMHCHKNPNLKVKVASRSNPDGIHFHLWKIPMEWKIIDTPKKTRKVPRKKTSPRRNTSLTRR